MSPARARCPRLVLTACLGVSACTMYDDTGNPDPGPYWTFVCSNGGQPVPASMPIDYIASGTCGPGGAFALSVDGCDMIGDWSVLGLSNVVTTQPARSPGLGGWSITGTASDGATWNCLTPDISPDLTITCTNASTSATACQSILMPVVGS